MTTKQLPVEVWILIYEYVGNDIGEKKRPIDWSLSLVFIVLTGCVAVVDILVIVYCE